MRIRRGLLPHTITVKPYAGASAYGPIYGNPLSYPARVELDIVATLGAQAHAVDATAVVFLEPEAAVTVNSTVAWVDALGQTHEFTVVKVAPMMGLSAPSHIEMLVK